MKLSDLKVTTYTQQRHQSLMVEGDTPSETSIYLAVSIAKTVALKTVGFITPFLISFCFLLQSFCIQRLLYPFKDETQTALFKFPVRTSQ